MQKNAQGQPSRDPLERGAILRAHPFFKGLDPAIVHELGPRSVVRTFRKGAVLFRKGDQGSSLYVVVSGAVRVDAPSEGGRSAVFNVFIPGEIFGEIAALDGGLRTADATAIERSEIMVFDRREMIPLLRKYPEFSLRVIEILCARVRRASEQVEDIVFLDLAGRLAKVLLFLQHKTTAASSHPKIQVTQREISQMAGASRESTNKQLREWQRAKILRIERGSIVLLQVAKLAEQAAEQ